MKIYAYFSFNGNCKEALDFYAKAFNGSITELHPYSENQEVCKNLPDKWWHDKIMHASSSAGDVLFMASDIMPGEGPCNQTVVPETTPISLSLNFDSIAEETQIFNNLANGGKITMPLQDTFWGAHFGTLTDKFGIKWLFNCDKK